MECLLGFKSVYELEIVPIVVAKETDLSPCNRHDVLQSELVLYDNVFQS